MITNYFIKSHKKIKIVKQKEIKHACLTEDEVSYLCFLVSWEDDWSEPLTATCKDQH